MSNPIQWCWSWTGSICMDKWGHSRKSILFFFLFAIWSIIHRHAFHPFHSMLHSIGTCTFLSFKYIPLVIVSFKSHLYLYIYYPLFLFQFLVLDYYCGWKLAIGNWNGNLLFNMSLFQLVGFPSPSPSAAGSSQDLSFFISHILIIIILSLNLSVVTIQSIPWQWTVSPYASIYCLYR